VRVIRGESEMDSDKVRSEIANIMMIKDFTERVDKTMEVIERETKLASDRSYYSAVFDTTGPLGCSWD
jgi:hypothetical protein